MFSIEHLNALREHEINQIVSRFRPGARVLEMGAGTGKQALEISRRGFEVEAIEIGSSTYDNDRIFPITEYDGRNFPFPDNSFDIVFSSNVLEHVPDLACAHREITRVLKPGGYCIHVVPTDAWRFWTTISAFPAAFQYAATLKDQIHVNFPVNRDELRRLRSVGSAVGNHLSAAFKQRRHGERGNLLTEIWYFRPRWWRRNFRQNGFEILREGPMGLFYTGNMVFQMNWPIPMREKLSRVLGSACHIFEVAPKEKRGA